MHLKDPKVSPPGNYRFKHPDGFTSTAITLPTLVRKVAQYRDNRGLPTISEGFSRLSEEVEHAICSAMTPEDQQAHCIGGMTAPASIHWGEVKRFLLTMATWSLKGLQTVPAEEANRRASICATCPYNVGTSGCGACRAALAGLRSGVLKSSTPLDDKLQACGVCGCDNKTQVHVPLEVLRQVKSGLEYPAHCWKAEQAASSS